MKVMMIFALLGDIKEWGGVLIAILVVGALCDFRCPFNGKFGCSSNGNLSSLSNNTVWCRFSLP